MTPHYNYRQPLTCGCLFCPLFLIVEIDILSDMARRISTYDYFIPAALHQNQKLQELGMVQSEIIARLSALTGQSQQEIVDLLTEATTEAVEDDIDYYTRADVYEPSEVNSEALYSQLNSGLLQTEQSFFNITRTTANTASKQFERALDRAWTQINVGGMDYNTAIRNAITDLGKSGIGSIEYKSGRIDNIEVAVRRAVVTGANQTAMKTQEVLADELGVELVEVTAHGGARPEHAKWQGKVFSRNGRVTIDGVTYEDLSKATGYGRADGLGGINCRHNFHPYVPGTSRAYSDKDLAELDKKKVEYNGEKYTEYEASQIQRRIERKIRKNKRTISALEAVGEDSGEYRAKLRDSQKEYTDFTNQTGIRKQSARTQVAKITPKSIDKTQKNDIIKAERASIRFVNSSDKLYKNAAKIKPKRGYEDIVIHGDRYGFAYNDKAGKEYLYSAREFAEILKNSAVYKGGKIRLISCETGASGSTAAQLLANQLNVEVLAPTDIVWVFPDGSMVVGPTEFDNTGKWKKFMPQGV